MRRSILYAGAHTRRPDRLAASYCRSVALSLRRNVAPCRDDPSKTRTLGTQGEGEPLKVGMFFTIEPMINTGGFGVKILSDGWTAVTKDRSLSAQFEHSLAVTDKGYEIFTLSPTGLDKPPYITS